MNSYQFLHKELSNSTYNKARKLTKDGQIESLSRHALDRTKSDMDYDGHTIKWVCTETCKDGNTTPV